MKAKRARVQHLDIMGRIEASEVNRKVLLRLNREAETEGRRAIKFVVATSGSRSITQIIDLIAALADKMVKSGSQGPLRIDLGLLVPADPVSCSITLSGANISTLAKHTIDLTVSFYPSD